MSVAPDLRLEVGLHGAPGAYHRYVEMLDGLVAYWRLNETSGTSAADASGNGHTGTYVSSPTLGAESPLSDEGETAVSLDGDGEYVSCPDLNITAGTSFTLCAWVFYRGRGSVGATDYSCVMGFSAGRRLLVNVAGFILAQVGGDNFFNDGSAAVVPGNTWTFLVYQYDATSNLQKWFVNGAAVGTDTPTTTPDWDGAFRIGDYDGTNYLWAGSIDEVAVFNTALTSDEIAELYALRTAGTWTDITDDLELHGGLHFSRGITGNGPTDCVAGGGTLSFTLDNSARNSGETAGWYSPLHDDVREGWTFDIPVRLSFIYGSPERIHFRGTIRVIDPEPGIYGEQRVHVEAYDLMRDLIDTDIREIDIAVDQREDEVIGAVLDLLPGEVLPETRDIDTGVDSFPYVFDTISPTSKLAEPIVDATISSFGLFAIKGDGTPMFRSRHTRALASSVFTFDAFRNVVIPSTLDQVFRVVRTSTHPKTIDPAATSVLYALEGTPPSIGPGETLTIWGDYRDTTDDRTLIGGLDRVVPIVASTDYLGNSQEDGLGSDLTSSLSVVTSDFATTAKFEITNGGSQTVFLTLLQIRGKRVLDIGVQTFQSPNEQTLTSTDRRRRPLLIDLKLQSDPHVGQSAADYVRSQYGEARRQISQLEYMPNYSAELLQQFMELEIGDTVTVTEEQTGLSAVDAVILSIDCEVADAVTLIVRYGLAPATPMRFWQWGIVGASEWGQTTVYAF